MPLTPVLQDPTPQRQGLCFAMSSAGDTIGVLVSHEALRATGGPALVTGTYKAQFEANRALLEQVASDKFDRGQIEPDGSILITAADLPSLIA